MQYLEQRQRIPPRRFTKSKKIWQILLHTMQATPIWEISFLFTKSTICCGKHILYSHVGEVATSPTLKPKTFYHNPSFHFHILFHCMKHLFCFILFAFATNAAAQDSTQQNRLQHSISATVETPSLAIPLVGLRYDARLRTPNLRIDWAFGAATSYYFENKKGTTSYNTFSNTRTDYEYTRNYKNYLTLHGLVLVGKKNFTFQTGLAFGILDNSYTTNQTEYSNKTSAIIREYGYTYTYQYLSLSVPVGVRYQSTKLPIVAWFDTGIGFSTLIGGSSYTYSGTKPKFNATSFLNLQIGIGYSFAPRPTHIH